MAAPSKAPKALIAAALLAAGLSSALFLVSDPIISAAASRSAGLSIRISGVRWMSLKSLRFTSVSVSDKNGKALLSSGVGEARLIFRERSPKALISLSQARLEPGLVPIPAGLRAEGGLMLSAGRLEAADLWAIVPEDLLGRLPEPWLRRLPSDGKGNRVLKCSFRNGILTLYGRSGPLLRASWEMVY